MRNAIMTPNDLDSALKVMVDMYFRMKHKAPNYSDTYTRHALLKFMHVVQDWTMFQHCIEDREAMTQRDKHDFEDWMENAIIDKQADEDQEYKDSLDKPPRNGN